MHETSLPPEQRDLYFKSILSILFPMIPDAPVIPTDIEANILKKLTEEKIDFMEICVLFMRLRDTTQNISSHLLKVKGRMVFFRDAREIKVKTSGAVHRQNYAILTFTLIQAACNLIETDPLQTGATAISILHCRRVISVMALEAYVRINHASDASVSEKVYDLFASGLVIFMARILKKTKKEMENMLIFERDLCAMCVETPTVITMSKIQGQVYAEVDCPMGGFSPEILAEFESPEKTVWYGALKSEEKVLYERWVKNDAANFFEEHVILPKNMWGKLPNLRNIYEKRFFRKEGDVYHVMMRMVRMGVPTAGFLKYPQENIRLTRMNMQAQLSFLLGSDNIYLHCFLEKKLFSKVLLQRVGWMKEAVMDKADFTVINDSINIWGLVFPKEERGLSVDKLLPLSEKILKEKSDLSELDASRLRWLDNHICALQKGQCPDPYFYPDLPFWAGIVKKRATCKKMMTILMGLLALEITKHLPEMHYITSCESGADASAAVVRFIKEMAIFMDKIGTAIEDVSLFNLKKAHKAQLEAILFSQTSVAHAVVQAGGFSGALGCIGVKNTASVIEHASFSNKIKKTLLYDRWFGSLGRRDRRLSFKHSRKHYTELSKSKSLHALKITLVLLDVKQGEDSKVIDLHAVIAKYMATHRLHDVNKTLTSAGRVHALCALMPETAKALRHMVSHDNIRHLSKVSIALLREAKVVLSEKEDEGVEEDTSVYKAFMQNFIKMHVASIDRTVKDLRNRVDWFDQNKNSFEPGSMRLKLVLLYKKLLGTLEGFYNRIIAEDGAVDQEATVLVALLFHDAKGFEMPTENVASFTLKEYEKIYAQLKTLVEKAQAESNIALSSVLEEAEKAFEVPEEEME